MPECKRIIEDMKDLSNIRHQYHWRSFAHRGDGIDDNASEITVNTVDTVSTCSNMTIDRYQSY